MDHIQSCIVFLQILPTKIEFVNIPYHPIFNVVNINIQEKIYQMDFEETTYIQTTNIDFSTPLVHFISQNVFLLKNPLVSTVSPRSSRGSIKVQSCEVLCHCWATKWASAKWPKSWEFRCGWGGVSGVVATQMELISQMVQKKTETVTATKNEATPEIPGKQSNMFSIWVVVSKYSLFSPRNLGIHDPIWRA